LIPSLTLPDPDDRHVLAAAIKAKANVIVTFNLADFPQSILAGFGIEAQHPDHFISGQLDLNPEGVCRAVRNQRAALKNPAQDIAQLLETLTLQRLPLTVNRLRRFAASL
jgi:PIN domain